MTAAQSMEEIIYNKGDDIIEQDDIGDSFFILEEGRVSVRVSLFFALNIETFIKLNIIYRIVI